MRRADVVFLDIISVHEIHDQVLLLGGGMPGVRDPGMVASAVAAPQTGYYGTLGELAAVYVFGLARNHGFVDGNKRTAAGALMAFLGANGFRVVLTDEWIAIVEAVASGATNRHELCDLIVARLLGGRDVALTSP